MAHLTGSERAQFVKAMFARIAPRYDLMNRIMTAGQDIRWRKVAIRRAKLPPGGLVLDLGAGTGDLGREAVRQQPTCRLVAVDLTMEMMRIGQARMPQQPGGLVVANWAAADAHHLPFPDNLFDAVVSGFLLRNIHDVYKSLVDQLRVLKPGGWVVALDTSPPPDSRFTPVVRFHLHTVIPALGRIIAKQPQDYRYLPDSTEHFLKPEQLSARFMEAGFAEIGYNRLMLGTVAIHWGRKPIRKVEN